MRPGPTAAGRAPITSRTANSPGISRPRSMPSPKPGRAGETQRTKPFRAGVSHPEHENRSRTEKEDRNFRRDAQARRDDPSSRQEIDLCRADLSRGEKMRMALG